MNKPLFLIPVVFCIFFIFSAGCSSYAEPEISITPALKQVNTSAETLTITYDITLDIENTGSNNAYDVNVMVLLSTPKDLPEYRFVHDNINIGTIEKHKSTSATRQLSLPMTQENYDIISRGGRKAEVETTVTRVSSNIMG